MDLTLSRMLLTLALASAVLAVAVPSAMAGTIGMRGAALEFGSAQDDPAHDVRVVQEGDEYQVLDKSAPLTAQAPCTQTGPGEARCPIAGVTGIVLSGGPRDDRLQNDTNTPSYVYGGSGFDVLVGGFGNDRIFGLGDDPDIDFIDGRGGDDFIDTRSRTPPDSPDRVECGEGNDQVLADFHDQVAADCESIERAGEPVAGGGDGGTGDGGTGGGTTDAQGNVVTPPTGAAGRTCAFRVIGTPADDNLKGTSAGDTVYGLLGNDRLRGLGGNDCLFGGSGRDRLDGGTGADRLRGERGDDRLSGAAGKDSLVGGAGNDQLFGGSGRNTYAGGTGNDRISSRNGIRERVNCGAGRDSVRADASDRLIRCERRRR